MVQKGECLAALIRKSCLSPTLQRIVGRPAVMEHAANSFARLVRLLLGQSAIAARKLEYGMTLVVLGLQVLLDVSIAGWLNKLRVLIH